MVNRHEAQIETDAGVFALRLHEANGQLSQRTIGRVQGDVQGFAQTSVHPGLSDFAEQDNQLAGFLQSVFQNLRAQRRVRDVQELRGRDETAFLGDGPCLVGRMGPCMRRKGLGTPRSPRVSRPAKKKRRGRSRSAVTFPYQVLEGSTAALRLRPPKDPVTDL